MSAPRAPLSPLLAILIGGIVVWGMVHALGAMRGANPVGPNWVRGAIVLGSFAAFLGLWLCLLSRRRKRVSPRPSSAEEEAK